MKKAIASLVVSLFATAAFAQTPAPAPAPDTQAAQGATTATKTHVKVAKKRVKHSMHKARHPLAKEVVAKKTKPAPATTQP